VRITWEHRPAYDALAYERTRVDLLANPNSLGLCGCVRESWRCVELPGLEVAKIQSNPERPLSGALWSYVARHFIDLRDEVFREDIYAADTFAAAKVAAERYLAEHLGFAFTTRFRNEYFYAFENTPKVVH
jgi:hypothetical protein